MARFKRFPATASLAQDANNADIISAILSSCGPSILSRSLIGQVGKRSRTLPAFFVAFSRFKVEFAQLALKNRVLENENVQLKTELSTMRNDMDFIQADVEAFRSRSSDFMESERKYTAEADEFHQVIKSLEVKVEQYGEFIRALVDLKLDNPVKRAALSVMNGEDFEEALINAVHVACQNKNSAWSRIVPALTSPHNTENCASTLDLTICARKDSLGRINADSWRSKARTISERADLATPSTSMLSDLCGKAASASTVIKSPSQVLENMLNTLKRGRSWPPRQEATDLSTPRSLQPLLLESADKDMISESSSILSEEIRNSLKLLPKQTEEVAGPLSILKNGVTAVTIPEKCKDALSPRIVRFAPHEENAIIMRPSSIDSTSSSLSYVSEAMGDRVINANPMEGQSREIISTEDNEFSGSESVLSEVYADLLNETETEYILADQDYADTNEERPTSPLAHNSDDDSSVSKYSESEMCDDEDFVLQGPLSQHSAQLERTTLTCSFTPTSRSIPLIPVRGQQLHHGAQEEGSVEHGRLPSIEEEDIVSEKPHALRSASGTLPEDTSSVRSSFGDQEPSAASDFDDEIPAERVNKRYGRVTISQVVSHVNDIPQPRESSSSLPRRNSSRNTSPSITTPTASLVMDKKTSEKQEKPVTASCSGIDIPVRRAVEGKRVGMRKATVPKGSYTQSSEPVTPHRSGLVPTVPKRIVPQQLHTNTHVASSSTPGDQITHSDCQLETSKPSAKELGKRRGVIMVEKPDITPAMRNSPIVEYTKSQCRDDNTTPCAASRERPDPKSGLHVHQSESISKPTREPRNVEKLPPTPVTPNRPSITGARAPMMLSQLEQSLKRMSTKAGADVSRFDSNIAELLDSLSSSDLGSLESAEPDDSDSDCEVLRGVHTDTQEFVRGPSDSRHSSRVLQSNGAGNESTVATPGTLRKYESTASSTSSESISSGFSGPSRRLPPPGPHTVFKKHSSAPAVATSDSTSLSESSSPSSLSVESPTVSRVSYRESRFGLARPTARLDKLSPISSKMILPTERDTALSTLRHKQFEGSPPDCKLPATLSSTPSSSPRSPFIPFIHGTGKARAGMRKLSSMSKASPPLSKPSGMTKSFGSSPQFRVERPKAVLPVTLSQPKPWPVLDVSAKVSPSQVKSKLASTATTSSKVTGLFQQINTSTLGSPSASSNKPRANTINTISPLPPRYHTPQSITPDSPTKPRSNTVNSISPHARSPLSQNVVNHARDFQSRSNHIPPVPKCPKESPPPSFVRPLGANGIEKTGAKSIAPLHIVKKGANPGKARESRPSAPTAAFMRPALLPPTPTVRRVSTSVAPLIPNWGNGDSGLSASQARSMLRSNNVSMR